MENTPVSVITGYLGSGKTTLLKKILADTKKRIAVVMNEFGEIGIDTKVIRGENVDIVELLNGCVCCSLTGELEAAVGEILRKVKPDMIVIETTGVAEPGNLITNIDNIKDVKLDSVIAVVDSDALIRFPKLGQTGREQIENADIILLNKMDLVHVDKVDDVENAVRSMNQRAKIIRTTYANVDTRILFGLEVEHALREHKAHSLIGMESFVYRSERLHNRSMFLSFVSRMPEKIYRAKGHVRFVDGPHFFSFVNGRYELSKSKEESTEIVFIGEGANEFREEVLKNLEECQM
jgi:G3E family GTPase